MPSPLVTDKMIDAKIIQGSNTLTGNNTFSGTNTFSGSTTISGAATISGASTITGAMLFQPADSGSASGDPSAFIHGAGTGAAPVTTATANTNFIEYRCETTTTTASSDTRAMYIRLYINGASTGGGDCVRAFTTVEDNIGTAHGAHISLNFEAAAGGSECSGQGIACRNTLHIPDVASWAPTGTYSALQAEIYGDGDDSDPAGATALSFIRVVLDGASAAAKADIEDDAFMFDFTGFTASSGHAIDNTSLAELPANSIAFKVRTDAGTYYIPAVAAAELN